MPPDPLADSDSRLLASVEAEARSRHESLLRLLAAREMEAHDFAEPPSHRIAVPRTVNEKLLWRRIFDHDPRFVTLSDKLACKAWVAGLGLDVEIPRVLWVGTDAAEIPPEAIEGDVVVKANHGSGTNLLLPRDLPERGSLVLQANAFLRQSYGRMFHEWAYFGIERKLFVEEMVGVGGPPLRELHYHTFGRHVERVVHLVDRFGDRRVANWDHAPEGGMRLSQGRASLTSPLLEESLPATHDRAKAIAAEIGSHFDYVRVDFMTDGTRLWMGEITVYNLAGFVLDCGHLEDCPMTRAWDLRRSWFLTTRHADPAMRSYAGALRRELDRADDGRTGPGRGKPDRSDKAAAAPGGWLSWRRIAALF